MLPNLSAMLAMLGMRTYLAHASHACPEPDGRYGDVTVRESCTVRRRSVFYCGLPLSSTCIRFHEAA